MKKNKIYRIASVAGMMLAFVACDEPVIDNQSENTEGRPDEVGVEVPDNNGSESGGSEGGEQGSEVFELPDTPNLFMRINEQGQQIFYYVISAQECGVRAYTEYDPNVSYHPEKEHRYTGDIVIPETVTYADRELRVTDIGWTAFFGDPITSLKLPSSIRSILALAFTHCDQLRSVEYASLEQLFSIEYDGAENPMRSGHQLYIAGEPITDLVVPDTLTEIPTGCLAGISLRSITIPESVRRIGESAFLEWQGERQVHFSSLRQVFDIEYASVYSNPLSGGQLYVGDDRIEDVVIPDGIREVKDYALAHYEGLKSIVVPEGVESIGYRAFDGCIGLQSVTLPQSLEQLGICFGGCTGLEEITIPDQVETLATSTFNGCTALREVTLGSSLSKIGQYAFKDCPVKRLCCRSVTPPTFDSPAAWGLEPETDGFYHIQLTVPTGSLEAYQKANIWKFFVNIVEEEEN